MVFLHDCGPEWHLEQAELMAAVSIDCGLYHTQSE